MRRPSRLLLRVIRADVTVPQPCQAPAVLINPNGSPTTYIAVNGSP